jgi:hypothetical protein
MDGLVLSTRLESRDKEDGLREVMAVQARTRVTYPSRR